MSTSINVFLNSHTQSLTNCIATCFQAPRAELGRCDRDYMACKALSVYYLAIYRESLVGKWRTVKPQGEKENWARHTMVVNTSWCSTEWVRVCKKHSGAGHRWSRGMGITSTQNRPKQERRARSLPAGSFLSRLLGVNIPALLSCVSWPIQGGAGRDGASVVWSGQHVGQADFVSWCQLEGAPNWWQQR